MMLFGKHLSNLLGLFLYESTSFVHYNWFYLIQFTLESHFHVMDLLTKVILDPRGRELRNITPGLVPTISLGNNATFSLIFIQER